MSYYNRQPQVSSQLLEDLVSVLRAVQDDVKQIKEETKNLADMVEELFGLLEEEEGEDGVLLDSDRIDDEECPDCAKLPEPQLCPGCKVLESEGQEISLETLDLSSLKR